MVPNGSAYANYPSFANNGTKTPPGGSTESAKYALGMVPADTFPAEWANYLFHGATAGITRLNADTGAIKKEINTFLSDRGITPDATAVNQLLQAIDKIFNVNVSADIAPESVRNGQRFFISASQAVTITLPAGSLGDVLYFINQSAFTATAGSFSIPAGGTMTLLYNGTAWQLVSGGKINGTDTTSGSDITTAKWGTARGIKIQDSDGTNISAEVSVDGSDNIILKLPSTIKASLTGNCSGSSGSCSGNAATATKLQTARKLKVNLGSTTDVTFDGSEDKTSIPISGTLGTGNGGTGITSNPSMLVNLGSTSAASVFASSPRPGITGTLPVGNGGTGTTSILGILQTLRNSVTGPNAGVEQTNYGIYVTKSKFSTDGGYIVFSNGLIVQWGKANKTGTSDNDRIITVSGLLFTKPPVVVFSSCFDSGGGDAWHPDITSITNSSFTVNTRQINKDDVPITWIAIGY